MKQDASSSVRSAGREENRRKLNNSNATTQAGVNWSSGYFLKVQYHLLSDAILRLRNNITIMYFDRYLSCLGSRFKLFY